MVPVFLIYSSLTLEKEEERNRANNRKWNTKSGVISNLIRI
jgi:hypothetical protein